MRGARRQARALRRQRVPGGEGRRRPADRPRAAARRGDRPPHAAHRLRLQPGAGLVDLRTFYGSLARGIFLSTQYVRHPSQPLYTPEPDIIHEVIGHGNMLGSPRFAALKRAAGEATERVQTDAALQMIADVFWFTLEFGVLYEDGELRAYGAGILSSYGEIEEFREMEIRPLDIKAMATAEYDITSYQPVLFGAASFGELEDVVGGFFTTVDDDTPARLSSTADV